MSSCQMMKSRMISGDREIASIFKQSQGKSTVSFEWDFSPVKTWIVKPNEGNISSVIVYATDITCSEENIIKIQEAEKIIYYVTENSLINCTSYKKKKVKVDYNYYNYSLTNVSQDQFQLIGDVLKSLEKNKMGDVIDKIKALGIDDLFEKELTFKELKSLKIKEGDYINLKIWPQLKSVKCPDGKCRLQVNAFGLLNFEKLGNLSGMNQLKYQEVSPFIFFCGSRYTAGNIYFRADEKMEFEHIIDENGFSCDINSFLLNNNEINFKLKLKWISRENLQTILMGKLEEFIKQKNNSLHYKVLQYITEIQTLNKVQSKSFAGDLNGKKINGHVELWWEPFDKCGKEIIECNEKEMVMTRSRVIYDGQTKRMTKDIDLIPIGLKQTVEIKEAPMAFIVKLCPEDVDSFLLDQMEMGKYKSDISSFKERLISYEKKSCKIPETNEIGKGFEFRWLLATVPKEVEKEEVDLLIEDYKLLETPNENRLKKDPFQKGKIFFDVYLKNLKNMEVIFKRSRIIEVTK